MIYIYIHTHYIPNITSTASSQRCKLRQRRRRPRWARHRLAPIWPRCTLPMPTIWEKYLAYIYMVSYIYICHMYIYILWYIWYDMVGYCISWYIYMTIYAMVCIYIYDNMVYIYGIHNISNTC